MASQRSRSSASRIDSVRRTASLEDSGHWSDHVGPAATPPTGLEQTALDQTRQGGTDRHASHAEGCGEVTLDREPGAGQVLADGECRDEPVGDLVDA